MLRESSTKEALAGADGAEADEAGNTVPNIPNLAAPIFSASDISVSC